MFRRNLLSNYGGTLFVAATQVAFIPLYIRWLGEAQWGTFSAVLALSAAMLTLEAGLSQSTARAFVGSAAGLAQTARQRLQRLQKRYLLTALTVVSAGLILAPLLGPLALPRGTGHAFWVFWLSMLMASAQIVGSLYRSVLLGLGAQPQLNALLVAFTSLRHGGGLAAAWLGAGPAGVAGVFAASFALEAAARRAFAVRLLDDLPSDGNDAEATNAPGLRLGAIPLILAGAFGALGTQLDRLLVGRAVDATALGHYAVAATVSLAMLQLVYPAANALLPRLGEFASGQDRRAIMRRTYALLLAVLALIWLMAVALASGGLTWWLNDARVAAAVAPLLMVHLVGTTLNVLCTPLHLLLLAKHRDRAILTVAVLCLGAQMASLAWLLGLSEMGVLAASVAWCFASATGLIAYSAFVFQDESHRPQRAA